MPASRTQHTPRTDRASLAIAAVREVYADLAARPVERDCVRRTECCQFRLTGRTRLAEPADGSCPMLDPRSGRCLIYDDRPFACRTHFCVAAGGPYSRREVLDLIRRLEAISAPLGGDGPRAIGSAVAAYM